MQYFAAGWYLLVSVGRQDCAFASQIPLVSPLHLSRASLNLTASQRALNDSERPPSIIS